MPALDSVLCLLVAAWDPEWGGIPHPPWHTPRVAKLGWHCLAERWLQATVPSHSEPSPWGSISSTCWGLCRDDEYQAARATVARTFQGRFDKFVVPCVVASGDVRDRNGLEPLSFRCGVFRLGRAAVAPRSSCSSVLTRAGRSSDLGLPDLPIAPTTRCTWSYGAPQWLQLSW